MSWSNWVDTVWWFPVWKSLEVSGSLWEGLQPQENRSLHRVLFFLHQTCQFETLRFSCWSGGGSRLSGEGKIWQSQNWLKGTFALMKMKVSCRCSGLWPKKIGTWCSLHKLEAQKSKTGMQPANCGAQTKWCQWWLCMAENGWFMLI
jgi:hypothetical protein